MPEQPNQKAAAKPSVQPSRGFLSRWFGSEPMTPALQQGIDIARRENPNLAPVNTYGPFSRMMAPKALGYANEFGNSIYVDPSKPELSSPQSVADVLLHEQTHLNQGASRGLLEKLFNRLKPADNYWQRPDEVEAYQAEKGRRASMGRPQPVYHSAMGGTYWPNDVRLRNERKVR